MLDRTETFVEKTDLRSWRRCRWWVDLPRRCQENIVTLESGVSGESRGLLIFLTLVLTVSLFRYSHNLMKIFMQAPLFIDFAHYYAYATAVQLGVNPFDGPAMAQIDETLQLRRAMAPPNYPPVFYLFMQPFLWMSFDTASWVWMGLGMLSLVGGVWVCSQRFQEWSWIQISAVLFLILNFQPLLENISLGQANLVMLFLITVAWWNIHLQRPVITGLAMAVIVHIKIQFAFLIIILWWMGQRRAAWHAVWLSVLAGVLGLAVLGIEHYRNYFQYILSMPQELTAWTVNLAPRGALYRLLDNFSATSLVADSIWMVGSLVFLLYLAMNIPRVTLPFSHPVDEVWGMGVAAVLLISPHTLEHHLVVLLLPLMMLLLRPEWSHWTRTNVVLFIGATLLLSARYSLERFPVFHQGWPSLLANGKLLGIVLLVVFLSRLVHQQRREAI